MAYNYYKILSIETSAGSHEIKRAYRKLAFKYHPDKSNDAKAKEFFQVLTEAYATLSDPIKKADYDRILNIEQSRIIEREINRSRSKRNNIPVTEELYKSVEKRIPLPPKFVRYVLFMTGLVFGLFIIVFPILETIEHTFSPTLIFVLLGFVLIIDSIAGLTGYKTRTFFEISRGFRNRF